MPKRMRSGSSFSPTICRAVSLTSSSQRLSDIARRCPRRESRRASRYRRAITTFTASHTTPSAATVRGRPGPSPMIGTSRSPDAAMTPSGVIMPLR